VWVIAQKIDNSHMSRRYLERTRQGIVTAFVRVMLLGATRYTDPAMANKDRMEHPDYRDYYVMPLYAAEHFEKLGKNCLYIKFGKKRVRNS
jgi:hypothetical protein